MSELSNTQFFQVGNAPQIQAKDILEIVYKALREKGYNPVNQIVGYIMSVSYTHLTLPTTQLKCRSRWSPYH